MAPEQQTPASVVEREPVSNPYKLAEASKAFLTEAARYFETRPTGGEDAAHWSNVFNAKNCREATALIERLLAEREGLREALDELQDVFAHDGECSVGRFDRLAEMFYRDTRMMAPGKDRGMGGPDQPDGAELRAIYDAWFAAKVTRARAALTQGESRQTEVSVAALEQIFDQIDCSAAVLEKHGPEITADGRGYVAASLIESLKDMADRARPAAPTPADERLNTDD